MAKIRIIEGSLTFRAKVQGGSTKSCTITDIDLSAEETEVEVTKENKYWVRIGGEKKFVDKTEEEEAF